MRINIRSYMRYLAGMSGLRPCSGGKMNRNEFFFYVLVAIVGLGLFYEGGINPGMKIHRLSSI